MTDMQADYDRLREQANDVVREHVAAFLAVLDIQMQDRFGGWEYTTACWRQDLSDDPAGQVARAVVQAMGGDVC